MQPCISLSLPPQMTLLLCYFVLCCLTFASQLGLEDVFFSPQDQSAGEGEAVFLQCVSGESSPPASITWLKDGQVVTKGRQFQGDYGGGQHKKTSGTLHLFNITLDDDGIYICVTNNHLLNISKKSKPAKLSVIALPQRLQLIQGPDNNTVAEGTEVSMRCTVRGLPVPMVHWFKDGCLLSNCSSSFSLQNNGQLLTYRNVSKENEGSYHCEASNWKETVKSQPAFLLLKEMYWSLLQQPTNLTVKRGENATLTCRPPHSKPEAHVSWFKDSQLLPSTENRTVLPSGDLFLHNVQENDSGIYFCRASNIRLQSFLTSRRATLTVLAPPSVRLRPTVVTLSEGEQAVLECEVSGHPLPSISWVKKGHSKQTGGKISFGIRTVTLHIQSVRSYDEAIYVCEASNMLGKSQGRALLRVAVTPIIVAFVSHVSSRTGASVVLPCRAVGVLPISYSWTRGRASSTSLKQGAHVDEDGSLHISSVEMSDKGEYLCTAENRAGQQQRCTILTVTTEDHPGDEKQTRLVLSTSTNTRADHVSKSRKSSAEHNLHTAQTRVLPQHEVTCFGCNIPTISPSISNVVTEKKLLLGMDDVQPPTLNPTQPFVTETQPPVSPALYQPNFQSGNLHHQMPQTREKLFTSNTQQAETANPFGSDPLLIVGRAASSHQIQHQVSDSLSDSQSTKFHVSSQENETKNMNKSRFSANLSLRPIHGDETQIPSSETHLVQITSEAGIFSASSQTDLLSSTPLSEPSQNSPLQKHIKSFEPKFHLEPDPMQWPSSSVTQPPSSRFRTVPFALPSEPLSSTQQHQRPSQSTTSPSPPGSESVTDQEAVRHGDWDSLQNATEMEKPPNTTEPVDWLKKNTSLSPMTSNNSKGTQKSPSWLPGLEKHDLPIVVGVGVSMVFIFITVTFYSVVQKNEPAPAGRAAQRNLAVPSRQGEYRSAARTYDNRAFEDDDCVTVIEQSPNTSDTRSRPPAPSVVTVQLEPTFQDNQEGTNSSVDCHSVTVETYPEPIVDTQIDTSFEEDKRCSFSQPSIQLQCSEYCPSDGGDNHSPCQEALPPPSSLPSHCPSPPCRREEALHSSLTLQSAESDIMPIHHSLSISHGSSPLLLSHHVSLGRTTVAVDVQFYPAASASTAVSTNTSISSVSNSTSVTAPAFSPPFTNCQENDDRSASRFHHSK